MKEFFSGDIYISGVKLPVNITEILIRFILPAVIILLIYRVSLLILFRLLARSSLSRETRHTIMSRTRLMFRIVILISLMVLVDRLLGDEVLTYLKLIPGIVNRPFFTTGNTSVSIMTLIMMVPVFYMGSWAGKIVYRIFDASFIDSVGIHDDRRFTIARLLKYGTTILMTIIGLSVIGIDLSSIAVILGVLGIGLGFGLQNLIANLFAGFVIIITRPVREGDLITVGQNRGVVTKINTISTIVTTLMNETIIVPNSVLISDVIYNDSYSDRSVIIKNSVTVSYESDILRVKEILGEIARRNPHALAGTDPDPRIFNFGNYGIEMVLYSTISDVANRGAAIAWNNFEIWEKFRDNGIVIPISQMDIRIRNDKKMEGPAGNQ